MVGVTILESTFSVFLKKIRSGFKESDISINVGFSKEIIIPFFTSRITKKNTLTDRVENFSK